MISSIQGNTKLRPIPVQIMKLWLIKASQTNALSLKIKKAQTYIALGNTLHTLAHLHIDSTPMEGIDSEMISKEFAEELDGHICHVALAIGYHDETMDYNAKLPKSRLAIEDMLVKL